MEEEKIYREIEELREEYSKTKDNKATNKHIGILRAKIAKLKKELEERRKSTKTEYAIRKQGDATIALVGYPNAGKSSIFSMITNKESKTGDYAFTTTNAIEGMMNYKDAHIQVLDLPGLLEEAETGRGGGRKFISMARIADLFVFVFEPSAVAKIAAMLGSLSKLGIRFGERKAILQIREKGGIEIENRSGIEESIIKEILSSFSIYNAKITIEKGCKEEEIIDEISGHAVYKKAMLVINKLDLVEDKNSLEREVRAYGLPFILVSAKENYGISELKEMIFKEAGIIRVYLRPKGENRLDLKPMIIKRGSTVGDLAKKIHSSLYENFHYAKVSGSSVKFENQKVGKGHVLEDGDSVAIY
ncbi:MAG: GTPase [Candidatus Micrarchaeaceae archaeon]